MGQHPLQLQPPQHGQPTDTDMDAIRKKMQSLKGETENLYSTIAAFEEATREASGRADQADCDIRDLGKKVQILKAVKVVENTCLNNEVTIEELDTNLRSTIKMAVDNEQKLDELSRKLGVQESELKRGLERAELAEKNLKSISLQNKYKITEARFEYGEMNITKLNQRIDDI